jgi:lysophospholipase L1-like esterase
LFDWYEGEIAALEHRREAAPPRPVAFYGSSSIRLWDSLAYDFAGTPVVNLGFGGSTMAACAYYFERVVVPFQPRSLVFYAGDNDLGDGQNPAAVLRSFDDLWAKFERDLPGIPFGFLSVKPSVQRWRLIDSIRAVNDGVRTRLADKPNALYLDVFSAMLSDTGGPRPELFVDDGLHLNREGYRIWWQVVGAHRHQLRM